jgi:L-ribulose-5-phosphate 4-epimerase
MDKDLVDRVVETAAAVVAGGAISTNGHGNISLRVPGGDEMYFTSAPSLKGLGADGVARVALGGALIEGHLPPIQGAVVAMHTAMYADSDEVGCVIHTHSPFATAYAVANRPIECWIEAMAMFGLADGVAVAAYAPRGSDEAVANIRQAVRPGNPAVLLANHGVLVFHRTPELAVLAGGVVEEAAQASLTAGLAGGPVVIPEEMRAAALQRAMAFADAGVRTA